jgi:hypothetical protein
VGYATRGAAHCPLIQKSTRALEGSAFFRAALARAIGLGETPAS